MIRIKPHKPKPRAPDAAAWGDGQKLPVTISLDKKMIERLDGKAHEMRQTRSAAIRILLTDVLDRRTEQDKP